MKKYDYSLARNLSAITGLTSLTWFFLYFLGPDNESSKFYYSMLASFAMFLLSLAYSALLVVLNARNSIRPDKTMKDELNNTIDPYYTKYFKDAGCITANTTLKVPSLFKGEVPFMSFYVTDDDGNNVEVGALWGTGGKLSFTGDADASAKLFFDNVVELNRNRLKEE